MIKKFLQRILFLAILSSSARLHAQVISVSSGAGLVLKAGTAFFADSIILTPSTDFTLSDITIGKSATVIHTASNPYIARVYQFSNNTDPFSGTIEIYYRDGAELNGIAKQDLQLNIFNGTAWQPISSTTNDVNNNYVLSTTFLATPLRELTLASVTSPLPLQWRSFTAINKDKAAWLEWSTFSEQNTQSFIVQTSTDGTLWHTLTTVPAAGNSKSVSNYSYLHTSPINGNNYYRIIQTDADNKFSFSEVRNVTFRLNLSKVEVITNPIINGKLKLKVTTSTPNGPPLAVSFYNMEGKILWVKKLGFGVHTINTSGYAKGIYLIEADGKATKILLQ